MNPVQEELVNWLSPKRDGHADTTTMIGTAMSDSSQGLVSVELDVSVLSDDDSYSEKTAVTQLPTTVYCEKGDTVIITLFGTDGVKKPTVTGVSGGGDKLNERVAEIEQHQPTGTIDITENGTYDVTTYATADVNVSGGGGGDFDWTQLSKAPNFSDSFTSSQCDMDASGIWVANAYGMFTPPSGVTSYLENFVAGTMDTSDCEDFRQMFASNKSIKTCDLHTLDTSSATSMNKMFYSCSALASVNISGLDLSSVTTLSDMFYNCSNLLSVDFSGMDLSSATSIVSMFSGCTALTSADFSGADLSAVTALGSAFLNCKALTSASFASTTGTADANFSGADLSAVTSVQEMFRGCTALTTVDFTGFTNKKISNTIGWFRGCTALVSFNHPNLKTASVANNSTYVFYGCTNLTALNAKAWTSDRAGGYFCQNCSSLESAFFPNQDTFRTYMFSGCSSLVCLIWAIDRDSSWALSAGSNQLTNTPIANGTGYVYVRDSAVNTYKSNGFLSSYASQVKPISECPQVYLDLYNIDPNDYQ